MIDFEVKRERWREEAHAATQLRIAIDAQNAALNAPPLPPPPPVAPASAKAAPAPSKATGWVTLRNCKAVDAATGLRCRKLEHPDAEPHRNERGVFNRAAAPGQSTFARRSAVDASAWDRPTATHGGEQ